MATNDNPDGKTEGGTLRDKLEEALKDLADLRKEHQADKQKLLFHDSGLGHLLDKDGKPTRRGKMLLNSFDDPAKVTASELQEAAKEEGWHEPPKNPSSQNGRKKVQDVQQGDEGGSEGVDDEQQTDGTDDNQDVWEEYALPEGLDNIEQAIIASRRGIPGALGKSFDDALKGAKTQDEVMELIRNRGGRVGLVVDEQ